MPAAHRGGLREAHSFTNGGHASYCTRSDREYSICGFVISLSYAELCLGLWDTANHRNDETPASVELTCPGMTDDVHINTQSDRRWCKNTEMGKI